MYCYYYVNFTISIYKLVVSAFNTVKKIDGADTQMKSYINAFLYTFAGPWVRVHTASTLNDDRKIDP